MTYHKTTTLRGNSACIVDGYVFIIERQSGDKTIWCCNRKIHGQCKGRLHTINDQLANKTDAHNHEQNANTAEVTDARAKMDEESKSSNRSAHDLIAGVIGS
ncbi:unnamed protein product [Rotaria sp. Silwood2]|nr:unnamed protein product [Rotaria sp. Silwood2]CAF4416763.1 unnamed protein product [Rotaria sp. Silwood2]CAF4508324.1 unnamed protein product [Rotaria sp. Silwood2]CAF4637264.1 unnamed protein product [Rotaria sp. Silwood2]CAF4755365.1 unnamed protein product [Rotaria sp. Silwood2]